MPIRLPRLTLFSGPQCSLCDVRHLVLLLLMLKSTNSLSQVAKAELHALRKQVGTSLMAFIDANAIDLVA